MTPGSLTLTLPDGETLTIAPGLTFSDFESFGASKLASMNYWGGGINAKLDRCDVHARRVTIELTFTNHILARTSLFVHLATDGKDWSDWTLAQEMARKLEHEALALALFGVALAPKPMDVNGKPVFPLELTPEYPRHAAFTWGEVVSGYDSKGGMAIMWIAYRPQQVA